MMGDGQPAAVDLFVDVGHYPIDFTRAAVFIWASPLSVPISQAHTFSIAVPSSTTTTASWKALLAALTPSMSAGWAKAPSAENVSKSAKSGKVFRGPMSVNPSRLSRSTAFGAGYVLVIGLYTSGIISDERGTLMN